MSAKADHDWVEPYIERVIAFLGLQAWTWNLEVSDRLEGRSGTRVDPADATCDPDWRYLDATITIDATCWHSKMSDPERRKAAKILLCHEVIHMLTAQTTHAMEQLINIYFPPEDETPSDKTTAFTVYSDHEEHVVTRLSRQVYEALERDERLAGMIRLVGELDPQLVKLTEDPDDPEKATVYQMKTGYWHNLLFYARDS